MVSVLVLNALSKDQSLISSGFKLSDLAIFALRSFIWSDFWTYVEACWRAKSKSLIYLAMTGAAGTPLKPGGGGKAGLVVEPEGAGGRGIAPPAGGRGIAGADRGGGVAPAVAAGGKGIAPADDFEGKTPGKGGGFTA